MDLSQSAIDSLFARMLVRYGDLWTRKWEGLDLAAVKAEWAHELSNTPEHAIMYALDYMPPDRPPATVKAFRALCNNAPAPAALALPRPKPTREERERVRSIIDGVKRRMAERRL